ncbi:MAG TPA: hemerythrin domain-containing protein [Candidatus Wallbacteria bacterium]|nr:hemerythrin domain-containing protein [Candidatus Wallbacteria bacterium]
MKATEILMEEHEAVLYVLSISEKICCKIESGAPFDLEHIGHIIDFLKTFVDKCHHGKEEDLLFPELEKVGIKKENGPIGVMLFEHTAGREYIKQLSEAFENYKKGQSGYSKEMVDAIRKYSELLIPHIQKENKVLYKMADMHLSKATDELLVAGFEKIEAIRIGAGKHEEFHKMIDALGKIYMND